MKSFKHLVIKNSAVNILGGGAGAFIALALPMILTRTLNTERFAAWCLILQIAAYSGYFNFGVQGAISNFVAYTGEHQDDDRRNRYVNSALALMAGLALLAFLIICVVAACFPLFFRNAPRAMCGEIQASVVCLGALSCALLIGNVFAGVLAGIHRLELCTLTSCLSRLLGALIAMLLAYRGHSLVLMTLALGACNLLAGFLQFWLARRLLPNLRFGISYVRRAELKEIFHFSAGLMIWSFSAFLISGLDLAIVGYFNFRAVGYYSIASNVVLVIAAICSAINGGMITPLVVLHARGEARRIGNVVIETTRFAASFLLLTAFLVTLFGGWLLRSWLESSYAQHAMPILLILLWGNVVRMLASAYSCALIGTAQHAKAVLSPLLEGVVNITASILLAHWIGAPGVAIGTLIGAFVGLGWHIAVNIPQTQAIQMSQREFFMGGIFQPIARTAPGFLLIAFAVWFHSKAYAAQSLRLVAISAGTLLLLREYSRLFADRTASSSQIPLPQITGTAALESQSKGEHVV